MTQAMPVGWIAAGAAIVGGLVSGAYQHARDWWTRPKLQLGFEPEDDKLEASWEGTHAFNGIVFRASIRNCGKRPALNCKVFVIALDKIHSSGTTLTGFKDSRQAPWAGWSFEPRAIYSAGTLYVDFVRVSKLASGWEFPYERTMAQDKALQGYRGIYRFQLVAVADNAEPCYLKIDVRYEGDWHNADAWMIPHP